MNDPNESFNSTEYILLTKSEYIEAKNFPSERTCKPAIPDPLVDLDRMNQTQLIEPFQNFALFLHYN